MNKIKFNNIENAIIEELENSKKSIDIAVSWFTNENLFNVILLKSKNGINIRLIILNDNVNNNKNGLDFQILINEGVQLYMCDGPNLMHNKYCIIDDTILINGSCNWTNKFESNDENIIIIKDLSICKQFKNNFETLLNKYFKINTYQKNTNELIINSEFIKIERPLKTINYINENLLIIGDKNTEKGFIKLVFLGKINDVNGIRGYNIGYDKTTRYVAMKIEEIMMLDFGDFIIYPKDQKINTSLYIDDNGRHREAHWMEFPILKASDFIKKRYRDHSVQVK